MVTPIEIALLILVLALLFGAFRIIKTVKPLIVNAIVGVIILVVANVAGLGIGMIDILVTRFISFRLAGVVIFLVLVLVLMIRPRGLFGEEGVMT